MTTSNLFLVFLIGALVNLIHWRSTPGESFSYLPSSGWLRHVFTALSLCLLLVSVGVLLGRVTADTFFTWMLSTGIAGEFYALGVRQSRREQSAVPNTTA